MIILIKRSRIFLSLMYGVWREFVWGGIAGAFGEGMMHLVDTLKYSHVLETCINETSIHKFFYYILRKSLSLIKKKNGF